ncbi:MAG: pyridoxamine 5'-phosphate oxidase family protein [candidate division NC10 bacterium]|nr:pyridoxamine 5'-phosphate oxidase family protein [candidate division NC10 bacterium]
MRLKKAEADFIRWARVCRVATVDQDGMPHNVPACPLLDDHKLYFATAGDAKKVKNLENNPRLALTFDDYTEAWEGLKGVMVQGEAALIPRGPRFRTIRRLLYQKYRQYESQAALEEGESVVVEVSIRKVFSWGL